MRVFARTVVVIVLLLLAGSAAWPPAASACSVPVFRYALERWVPSDYDLVIFHRGAMADADKAAVDSLEKKVAAARGGTGVCNVAIQKVDLAKEPEAALKELWATQEKQKPELPWAVLVYPGKPGVPGRQVAWTGRLTAAVADKLIDSPVRRDVAKRIQKGESAVWILLESGKRAKDNAAEKLLKTELEKAQKELKIGDMDPNDPAWQGASSPTAELAKQLRVAFSTIRLARTDAAEQLLISTLLHSEPDLAVGDLAAEPMAFVIFGQGRLLYAIVGKGINAENIQGACAFIVGPCSCVVKEENPGRDLLISADWGSALGGSAIQTIQLPPLTGLPGPPPALEEKGPGEKKP